MHPCYDFHDKVTLERICPPHTMCPILCYTTQEAWLRESQKVTLVYQWEADSTSTLGWWTRALHTPFPVCLEHRTPKYSTPFKILLLCSDLKGLQQENPLVTFLSPARANLSKTV